MTSLCTISNIVFQMPSFHDDHIGSYSAFLNMVSPKSVWLYRLWEWRILLTKGRSFLNKIWGIQRSRKKITVSQLWRYQLCTTFHYSEKSSTKMIFRTLFFSLKFDKVYKYHIFFRLLLPVLIFFKSLFSSFINHIPNVQIN